MHTLGLGLDLVEVLPFTQLLMSATFIDSVFTAAERSAADQLPDARRGQHLAGRFAAKEAFVKAWSSALAAPDRLVPEVEAWQGIEIHTDAVGRPELRLLEPVAGAVGQSLGRVVSHVSITHESSMAAAVVMIGRPT